MIAMHGGEHKEQQHRQHPSLRFYFPMSAILVLNPLSGLLGFWGKLDSVFHLSRAYSLPHSPFRNFALFKPSLCSLVRDS